MGSPRDGKTLQKAANLAAFSLRRNLPAIWIGQDISVSVAGASTNCRFQPSTRASSQFFLKGEI
jgi:hypothetical protein